MNRHGSAGPLAALPVEARLIIFGTYPNSSSNVLKLSKTCHAVAPFLPLRHGHIIYETYRNKSDKGAVIRSLLAEAPFSDRIRIIVGDDDTNEAGVVVVDAFGCVSSKIGQQ